MNEAAAAGAAAPAALACGNCRGPLRALHLGGHYGRSVEVDLCGPCHLLWFDSLEASRLTGASMLTLVEAMAGAQAQPHHALGPALRCPRCAGALKPVHNRSRFGASEQLECARGHGAWSTFAQWLSDRGLMRPLTAADRAALQARSDAGWCCLNCGAPLGAADAATCRYCGTGVGVLDIARLAAALDPEGAAEGTAEGADVRRRARERHTFRCHACGHASSGQPSTTCGQCGATQISTDLRAVHAAVARLGPVLQAHARVPMPHVRERRLRALESDLERRRETVRDLERSAQGRDPGVEASGSDGVRLLDVLLGRAGVPWAWRAVFWVGVGLLAAWVLGG